MLAADEARRVHMFIDELDEAERALLKLRLDLGLDPPEIRRAAGAHRPPVPPYRRAGRQVAAGSVPGVRQGRVGTRQAQPPLCLRHGHRVRGPARAGAAADRRGPVLPGDDERAARAGRQRSGAPAAAGDHRGRRAPATTGWAPAPPSCSATSRPSVADLASRAGGGGGAKDSPLTTLSNVKRQAGETLMGAKQHATNTYVRVADPTPLTGARPGTAVAIVASCVAAGGGAYCAVEGVPESLRAPLGLDRSQADTRPAAKPADAPPADQPSPTPPPPVLPADPPAQQQQPAATPPPATPRRHRSRPRRHRPSPRTSSSPRPSPRPPRTRPPPPRPASRHPRAGAGRRRGVLAVTRPVTAVSPGGREMSKRVLIGCPRRPRGGGLRPDGGRGRHLPGGRVPV